MSKEKVLIVGSNIFGACLILFWAQSVFSLLFLYGFSLACIALTHTYLLAAKSSHELKSSAHRMGLAFLFLLHFGLIGGSIIVLVLFFVLVKHHVPIDLSPTEIWMVILGTLSAMIGSIFGAFYKVKIHHSEPFGVLHLMLVPYLQLVPLVIVFNTIDWSLALTIILFFASKTMIEYVMYYIKWNVSSMLPVDGLKNVDEILARQWERDLERRFSQKALREKLERAIEKESSGEDLVHFINTTSVKTLENIYAACVSYPEKWIGTQIQKMNPQWFEKQKSENSKPWEASHRAFAKKIAQNMRQNRGK